MLLAIGYLTFYFEVSDFTVSHWLQIWCHPRPDFSPGPDHGEPDSAAGDRHHRGQHPDHTPRHPLPQADRHLALRVHEHDGK